MKLLRLFHVFTLLFLGTFLYSTFGWLWFDYDYGEKKTAAVLLFFFVSTMVSLLLEAFVFENKKK